MILDKYEGAFRSLTPDEVHCIAVGLAKTHPELCELGDFEEGQVLVDWCRASHVSQAECIMALSRDVSPTAVAAVEKLIMRPIDRRSPAEVERERDASRPRPQPVAPVRSNEALTDGRIIRVLATENPKRAGTKSHERWKLYRDGITIAEYLRNGGTRGDLQWDQERGFIKVDPAA